MNNCGESQNCISILIAKMQSYFSLLNTVKYFATSFFAIVEKLDSVPCSWLYIKIDWRAVNGTCLKLPIHTGKQVESYYFALGARNG